MRRTLTAAVCVLLGGCDKLFSLTHIDRDADIDAAPCPARSIATGKDHTCSVDYLGRVFCWGLNADKQVQAGGTDYVLEPTRVVLPAATQVTSGRDFSCARLDDGAVWCWGNNFFGQLGRGATTIDNGPFLIEGIPPSAEVRTGGMTACSRSAGTGEIWCWGSNRDRNAGQETDVLCKGNEGCVTPSLVPGTDGAKALAMGHRHACIIDATDHIACWGKNLYAQLGDGGGPQRTLPAGIPQLGTVSAIGASGRTTCVADATGAMQCWGSGGEGQLATGSFDSAGFPVTTKLDSDVTQIALGGFGGCALMAGGTVRCWGMLDAGTGVAAVAQTPVMTDLDGVTELSSHFDHTCAIARGDIYCWGEDSDGQLGRGTQAISPTPLAVGAPGSLHVAVGETFACAQRSDGIYCWGVNARGEVGSGNLVRQYVPVRVETTLPSITGFVAGFERTCIWGNGAGECWGRGSQFALGNGVDQRQFTTPQRLLDGQVADVAIGRLHTCVRHPDDTITCYGANGKGQLGASPATVSTSGNGITPSVSGVKKIAAGGGHTCVLSSTAAVSCWGDNTHGQLGDGSTTTRYTPAIVNGLGTVVDLKAGANYTCALDTMGAIFCWGYNGDGQLGDGTHTGKRTATKVKLPAGRTATSMAAGTNTACAKLDNGQVACWGANAASGLATGTMGSIATPAVSPGFANATEIATGQQGTCALDAAGQVTCAGAKSFLADDDQSSSVPTLISHSACAE